MIHNFLVILVLVLWTLLMVISGYAAGSQNAMDEQKTPKIVVDTEQQRRLNTLWADHLVSRPNQDICNDIETLKEHIRRQRVKIENVDKEIVATKNRIDDMKAILDVLRNGSTSVEGIDEAMDALRDRVRRVERKTGMSV